ncbi:putative hydrolases or acyltransferase, partial [Myriangium duriaei CBS 260.36]
MAPYTKLPSKAKVKPDPFTAHISDEKLKQMIDLVKLSPIGAESWENLDESRTWGMNRKWLSEAKDHWANKFDWRATEKRINSFPNYTVPIKDDDGSEYTMHFIALFSDNENAIPLIFYHGWPGSFLEFLDMLDHIKKQYSPDKLPYHIIVPSLPGYTFSSGPPTNKDASRIEMTRVCFKLVHQLGFEDGYIAQGGDLGSFVSRQSAQEDPACKAFHLNMVMVKPPENKNELKLDELEIKYAPKGQRWLDVGTAYGQEHGTRTGTIGLALSASPLALLSWIGEKFLEWSDQDPPLDQILEGVSLYWLTDTIPRCLYPYRSLYGPKRAEIQKRSESTKEGAKNKPMGYSWFPHELVPTPVSWAATSGNLVWHKRHSSGGHFAAMEKPVELWNDVEEFVKVAWK